MYPGLVYYLTFWYRPEERSLRIASFLANASLAGAFGGSIAYGVGHMNGMAGLTGWQWLFILEGIPSCLFAVVILTFLPDWPEGAKFLSTEEKTLAADRMRSCGSKGSDKAITWADTKSTLMDWRLYAHYLVSILLASPANDNAVLYRLADSPSQSCTFLSRCHSLASTFSSRL